MKELKKRDILEGVREGKMKRENTSLPKEYKGRRDEEYKHMKTWRS